MGIKDGIYIFQSTLPARGATQASCRTRFPAWISIHAPRTGSDALWGLPSPLYGGISIHAPRTGSDTKPWLKGMFAIPFQSTLPARGATIRGGTGYAIWLISIHAPRTGSDSARIASRVRHLYFNPRSPHGERHQALADLPVTIEISIHAPRTGSDKRIDVADVPNQISIHAPRTGSDPPARPASALSSHFNPRSPHGERRVVLSQNRVCSVFQSTLPARGATDSIAPTGDIHGISIHAPRTGSDSVISSVGMQNTYFNPRSPHGERHCWQWQRNKNI